MKNIYLSNWTFEKTLIKKKTIVHVKDILITGDDEAELIKDEYYKKKALKSIGVKDLDNYRAVKVQILKQIGTPTNE